MVIRCLSLALLLLLVVPVVIRGLMLRRRGVNAFLFGVTDKGDFLLMPMVALFVYTILSCALPLPFFALLTDTFWKNEPMQYLGAGLCLAAIVWIGLTLRDFGTSFRVGIDDRSPDKLVTNGMFSLSRNPIYVAAFGFFAGMFLIYPNLGILIAFVLFAGAIHRQILREERFLRKHYGKEFEDYCRNTRRYL